MRTDVTKVDWSSRVERIEVDLIKRLIQINLSEVNLN